MADRYDSEQHRRRSIRLPEYDYAQPGAYFVTIVTHDREFLLGTVAGCEVQLNNCGEAVRHAWLELPQHYPCVCLDEFVVMPNHVHGIVVIGSAPNASRRHRLSEIVRGFKTFASRRVNGIRATPGVPVWQRNYYEHIVRDNPEFDRVRAYVAANPARWSSDYENPARRR